MIFHSRFGYASRYNALRMACVAAGVLFSPGAGADTPGFTKPDVRHASGHLRVDVADALVSLEARAISVVDIITELARQSNLQIVLDEPIEGTVSLELVRVSMPVALTRILKDHDFALKVVHDSRGEVDAATLWVFHRSPNEQAPSGHDVSAAERHSGSVEQRANERMNAVQRYAALEEQEALAYLNEALADVDPVVRKKAVTLLADLESDGASSMLITALWDSDAHVREEAVHALRQTGEAMLTQSLHNALADPNDSVRSAAIQALVDIDFADSEQLLRAALNDPNPSLRADVLAALGEMGGNAAIDLIENALEDDDTGVRIAAVESLPNFDEKDAIGALSIGLQDRHAEVREAAIYALSEIGSNEAVQLASKALEDAHPAVRAAARALRTRNAMPTSRN